MTNKFKYLKNQTILVTGGTGSIGSYLVKQILKNQPKLVKIYARGEYKHFQLIQELAQKFEKDKFKNVIGDVRNSQRLNQACQNVDIIFHTAGLKHISFCNQNPQEAIATNITGAQNLIQAAVNNNVKKVFAISTDKAVEPTTTMGATKFVMERLFLKALDINPRSKTLFSVVRFGNIINSKGSVLPLWQKQIQNNQPITVTDKEMKRYFMTIPKAVNGILSIVEYMQGKEIFVLKMEEISIYELAQETINKYSPEKQVKIKIIGRRGHEKTQEKLFNPVEKKFIYEKDLCYIILPDRKTYLERRDKYEKV